MKHATRFANFKPWLVLGTALLLAACSVLPEAPDLEIHSLPVASGSRTAAAAPQVDWSLRVATPQASASLSSARIVVLPEANLISVYQGVRWTDPAPALWRDRLIEAFRRDGRVTAIGSDLTALMTDYELDGDLGAFQSEYQGDRPEVVVRFDARLIRRSSLRIVATERFEVREAAAGVQVPEVVQAFGRAADRLSAAVVDWTVSQGDAGQAR